MRALTSSLALFLAATAFVVGQPAVAEPPVASYIFPAGGQQGTTVAMRVGGLYLNDACNFDLLGPGVLASKRIAATKTVWFEGPLLYPPLSQQPEVYPKDFSGSVRIDSSAVPGIRYWRVSTSQGATALKKFVVGELPEIVEDEIDGDPVPTPIKLPVTINGRIFPREDVDIWTFPARAGDVVSCEVAAARIGSPLDARLEVRRADGRLVAENVNVPGPDAGLRFTAPSDNEYQLRICDAAFRGNQDYVYRLTVTKGPVLDAVYPLGGRRNSQLELHLTGANLAKDIVRVKLPADAALSAVVRPRIGEGTPHGGRTRNRRPARVRRRDCRRASGWGSSSESARHPERSHSSPRRGRHLAGDGPQGGQLFARPPGRPLRLTARLSVDDPRF